MASKLVADYAASAQQLIDALRRHAEGARDGAAATLAPMCASSEKVPDVGFLAELLARRLEHDRAELERAEQQKQAEVADAFDPRVRRDLAAHELHATLLEVRRTVGALFGPVWLKKLAIPASLHDDGTSALLRAGKDVAKALKDRALPKPHVDGVKAIDAGPWRKRINAAVKELDAATRAVSVDARELGDANATKAGAVAAFERSFAASSSLARGVLELAGKDDAAADVPRQPRRAPAKKRKKDAPAPPQPAPPAPPTPPAPPQDPST
jgi:hypothetical protein